MTNSYSQNGEDLIVLDYFKGRKGNLLEIGANNGKTLSNSLALIENDWRAWLVEPGKTFDSLCELHRINPKVHTYNFGIGDKNSRVPFFESGAHVKGGDDTGLVSSVNEFETVRWRNSGVQFEVTEIQLVTFKTFYRTIGKPALDFISIDAEGYDWQILRQIDLNEVGCKCLCIEWNSIGDLLFDYTAYCDRFGLKEIHRNAENIIFAR